MPLLTNKRQALSLFLLFAFALGIRIVYLFDLQRIPYFDHIPSAFDHFNLDLSAINFANGDWLAHAPNNSFAPLYKYFLGVIYWTFGRNFYVIYSIQFAMGALASVLIYLVTRDMFGQRAGLLAFLGFALHTTEIIYEGIILREAFITFWGVVSFYLLSRLRVKDDANPPQDVGIGSLIWATLALSMFIQGRPNTILCLPFVCVYLHKYVFLDDKGKLRRWLVFSGTLMGSFIPLLIQCYLVHGRFVFFDASGPHTFLSGNLIGYSGVGFDADVIEKYQKEHDLGYAANIKFLLRHIAENPVEFVKLYLRKIYYFFNDFESPTNISVYLYREFSGLLPWLLNHFAIFSSLGLVGIALSFRQWKDLFLLYSYAFSLALGVILFLIEDRYRLPSVPYFIMFSAFAVDTIIRWIEQKNYRNGLIATTVAILLFAGFAQTEGLVKIRDTDFNNLALEYDARGDQEKTNYYLNRILAAEPFGALTFYYKGQYHYQKQEWEKAAFFLETLVQSKADTGQARQQLIQSLFVLGKTHMDNKNYEEAVKWFNKLLFYEPGFAEYHTDMGICYYQLSLKNEAWMHVQMALNLDSEYLPAKQLLLQLSEK